MEIQLSEAYDEAYRALGESIVRERLLSRIMQNHHTSVPNNHTDTGLQLQQDQEPQPPPTLDS